VDLRVDNILLFPDLEQKFELFEPVRSMQVGHLAVWVVEECVSGVCARNPKPAVARTRSAHPPPAPCR